MVTLLQLFQEDKSDDCCYSAAADNDKYDGDAFDEDEADNYDDESSNLLRYY